MNNIKIINKLKFTIMEIDRYNVIIEEMLKQYMLHDLIEVMQKYKEVEDEDTSIAMDIINKTIRNLKVIATVQDDSIILDIKNSGIVTAKYCCMFNQQLNKIKVDYEIVKEGDLIVNCNNFTHYF